MSSQNTDKNKRSTYKKITEEIRKQLILRVIQKNENIKQVVNDMNVNISTAKAIIKVYQQEGRVGKKKKRDKVINVIQTYSFFTIDGTAIQKIGDTVVQQQKKSIQTTQSSEIQTQLKQKSKQRAQQLMKQIMQRHSIQPVGDTKNQQSQPIPNELTEFHNQMLYQFYNQGFGGYVGMSFPFK